MDLTIRGQKYFIEAISDTQILPLAKVFGLKNVPDEDSPHYERWKTETTNVFMEPANQAAVAYVLTSLIPDIDPAIARYRIKRYDEGFSELDFSLAINIDELLQVIELLNPAIQARADSLKARNTQAKGKGFAKAPQPTGDTKRIEALEAELSQLKSAV
jgi:hypothetical protein